jgi:hypothetical protein
MTYDPHSTSHSPRPTELEQANDMLRRLLYHSSQIATCMADHPEMTAREIAGDFADKNDPAGEWLEAIEAARKWLVP